MVNHLILADYYQELGDFITSSWLINEKQLPPSVTSFAGAGSGNGNGAGTGYGDGDGDGFGFW